MLHRALGVAAKATMEHGLKTVECPRKRSGSVERLLSRALQTAGLNVTMIKDITPIHTMDAGHLEKESKRKGVTIHG